MDKNIRIQDDLFTYVNQEKIDQLVIPDDKPVAGGFAELHDNVEVYNPYGYIENISIKEFIDRASFKAYEHLPMFLGFGFAYGAFEKNTIFYVK